jgi:hypothetical protein
MKAISFSIRMAFVFLIICAGFLAFKSTKDKTGDGTNMKGKWIVLFDGKSTAGWRGYNMDRFPDSVWVIDHGTLKCNGSVRPRADLIFTKKFKDFDLKLEWKISPTGNSGIFYFAQEIPGAPIYKSGLEMQVMDNENPESFTGVNGIHKAGSVYDLIPAKIHNTKPVGQWNEAEIIVSKGTVIHKQNGVEVLEYKIESTEFNEIISNSVFKNLPSFAQYTEGYIGLQDWSGDVWYRKIKIIEL